MCQDGNAVKDIGYEFFLQRDTDLDTLTPTELCTHHFFGGSQGGNLGGYCAHPEGAAASADQARHFIIEDAFKSPKYTNDFFPPQLEQLLFVKVLEWYCQAKCSCPREKEEDILERQQLWSSMKARIEIKDSNLNSGESQTKLI